MSESFHYDVSCYVTRHLHVPRQLNKQVKA